LNETARLHGGALSGASKVESAGWAQSVDCVMAASCDRLMIKPPIAMTVPSVKNPSPV